MHANPFADQTVHLTFSILRVTLSIRLSLRIQKTQIATNSNADTIAARSNAHRRRCLMSPPLLPVLPRILGNGQVWLASRSRTRGSGRGEFFCDATTKSLT